jgi:hypothetical protein
MIGCNERSTGGIVRGIDAVLPLQFAMAVYLKKNEGLSN